VKSSFVRAPGTLIAPLAAIQPPVKRAVTGVATLSRLVYFTVTEMCKTTRSEQERDIYDAIGRAGISFYLNSMGPATSSFIVDQANARKTEELLQELGLKYDLDENCEMVSVVALNMWEEPGFLWTIAQALADAGLPMLQMADSECSVACLVRAEDAPKAVKALHDRFSLGAGAA
jgi:aspartate kinase